MVSHKKSGESPPAMDSLWGAVFEAAFDGIIVFDNQGKIDSANAAMERLFGYSNKELRQLDVGKLMPELDWKSWDQGPARGAGAHNRIIGAGRHVSAVRKNGARFTVDFATAPLQVGDRQLFMGTIRDIADRLHALQQIESLNNVLEQRVAERTALAEQRAQQLRALATELTQAEQRERRRLATDLHDYLAQLLVACRMRTGLAVRSAGPGATAGLINEIDGLLNEAITYTRTLIAELSPTVLYEAGLAAGVHWLAGQMEQRHNLKVIVEYDGDPIPQAEDQAVLVFHAIRELLFNVVKHARVPQAKVSLGSHDGLLTVTVSDEGSGFDPAARVQDPATGKYGLFNLRDRLDALGGRLQVDSQPERGVRATIVLPLPPAERSAASAESKSGAAPRSSRRAAKLRESRGDTPIRVLLVDDHEIVRKGVRRILESIKDLELVGEGADGEEAVELARSLHPDVVVMDINMPRMNGIEATRVIKEQMPDIGVIGLSVYDDKEVANAMKEAGASSYLTKGGAIEELHQAICLAASGSERTAV